MIYAWHSDGVHCIDLFSRLVAVVLRLHAAKEIRRQLKAERAHDSLTALTPLFGLILALAPWVGARTGQ